MDQTVVVKQIRSSIRKNGRNLLYLKALGLGKIGRQKTLRKTPEVLGLLKKVGHLISVTGETHEA